jgi:hypothetical protein
LLFIFLYRDKHDSNTIPLVNLQRSYGRPLAATVITAAYGIRWQLARIDFKLAGIRIRALKLMNRKRAVRSSVA